MYLETEFQDLKFLSYTQKKLRPLCTPIFRGFRKIHKNQLRYRTCTLKFHGHVWRVSFSERQLFIVIVLFYYIKNKNPLWIFVSIFLCDLINRFDNSNWFCSLFPFFLFLFLFDSFLIRFIPPLNHNYTQFKKSFSCQFPLIFSTCIQCGTISTAQSEWNVLRFFYEHPTWLNFSCPSEGWFY